MKLPFFKQKPNNADKDVKVGFYGSFRKVKSRDQLYDIILKESTETANRVMGITMLHLAMGLLLNYILETLEKTNYEYSIYEAQSLVCAIVCYGVPTVIAMIGKYKKPFHRPMLITAMVVGGMFSYVAFNYMGRLFILLPLVMVGGYCSIRICTRTVVGTCLVAPLSIFAAYWLDIHINHVMGFTWEVDDIILNTVLPMALFVVILYTTTVFITRGRINATERMIQVVMVSERRDTELETAVTIQGEIFKHPLDLSQYGDIDIAGDIIAAHDVAGDFYDYFMTPSGKLVLVVGDVLDKGIAAAMFMIGARNTLRALFNVSDDTDKIMETANDVCCETSAEALVSVFIAVIDPTTGEGEYVNAGHTPPIVLHADGTAGYIECEPQMTLGTFDGTQYVSHPLFMEKGDILVMYTDGISEAVDKDGNEYDMTRPADIIRNAPAGCGAKDLVSAIRADVEGFSDTARRAADDRTILVMRWGNETPGTRSGTWHLEMGLNNTPNTAGALEVVNQTLERAGTEDSVRRSVDCAVDDLLSNIIDYSGAGSVHMTVKATGRFCRVSISDDGSPFNPYHYTNAGRELLSEGGRGIALVRALMDETAYYHNGRNINTITKYQ